MLWRQTFDTPSYKKFFAPPEEQQWTRSIPTTVEGVWDRVTSKSYIAILPTEKKAELEKEIKAALSPREDKTWIDESRGIFEYPYKTYLVTMKRQ